MAASMCRTASTMASKPLVISAFSASWPSRSRESRFSPACVSFSSRAKPRNPQLPLMVWIVRKMLARSSLEEGSLSSFTSSWSSRSRFSLLSIRKSLTISSIDFAYRLSVLAFCLYATIGILGRQLKFQSWSFGAGIAVWTRLKAALCAPYTGSMHVHVHGAGGPTRVLKISLAVTLAYIVLLVVAGIRAHSLALLSEAGHNLSDFLALLLSLVAVYFQSRPANSTKTYGYHRAGVLAALVNATSLVAVSFFIFYEAFRRLQHPEHVQASVMMWVAAAGVVMNGVIALLLYRQARAPAAT